MWRCHACTGFLLLLAATSASAAGVLESAGQQGLHALPARHLPWRGNGSCGEPMYDEHTGATTVSCLGPKQILSPGQTEDVMITLASPYPEGVMSVVLSQTSQMVDEDLKPVPLSDVYVHHYGGQANFLIGSGAEIRGSLSRKPLPEPYHMIVNGTEVASQAARLTNIQLINTVGLPLEQAKPCLECWCGHDSFASHTSSNLTVGQQHAQTDRGDPTFANARPASLKGSLLCCHQCPTTSDAGPKGYHLQYNVTFRPLQEHDTANATSFTFLDVVGGNFEYQITDSLGPNSTHTLVHDTVYDQLCPQRHNIDILRCTGHQHFGGQCIELINLDKNEPICKSCPDFGIKWGVPGDEAGYVVKIEDDTLPAPYTIAPGTHVRMVSTYSSEVPRFGVMGLMFVWQAGQYEPCHIAPNVSSTTYTATTSGSDTDILVPLYGHGMFGVGADLPAGTNVHVS